jgi:ligand-binding sensor domain-containing protein
VVTAVVAGPAGAQGRIGWAPDERVLVGDFTTIIGLARDSWRIYAATPDGLLTWDPARHAWELPLTSEDGYPAAEQPVTLRWSDAEQALVLGTRAGRLWRLDPLGGRVAPLGPGSQPPADPATERDERLRSLGASLGLDERLRRWRVTATVPGTRPDEHFVGTAGGGMLRVDTRTLQVTGMPYGLSGRIVRAITRLGDRLWFAGDAEDRRRAAVTSADTSLQEWSWPDPLQGAPAGAVGELAAVGGTLWAGGPGGLYRLRPGAGWERFGTSDNLPADAVTALAVADSALWVGTRRGVCLWRGDVCGPTLLAGFEATALSYCARSLWIGTDRGLWRASAESMSREEPPGFGGRVQALACRDGSLYLAGPRELLVHADGAWRPPLPMAGSGTLRDLAADGTGVWVAGDAGAARWDPAARAWSVYLVPHDIPAGPVLSVYPDGDRVWLGTPAGALRLDLRGR